MRINTSKIQEDLWSRSREENPVFVVFLDVLFDTYNHSILIFETFSKPSTYELRERKITHVLQSVLSDLVKFAIAHATSPLKLVYQLGSVALYPDETTTIDKFIHHKPYKSEISKFFGEYRKYIKNHSLLKRIERIAVPLFYACITIACKGEKTVHYAREFIQFYSLKDTLKNGEKILFSISELVIALLFAPIHVVYEAATNSKSAEAFKKGYVIRNAFLPRTLFPIIKRKCKEIEADSNSVTKATAGSIPVFLPEETPGLVFKKTNRKVGRFGQIIEARMILRSQGSTHLIVPKVRGYQNFLIEERLPIHTSSNQNMLEYYENLSKYDEAVREFTRFFSQVSIGDIVTDSPHHIMRYDNFPLFDGKIGLIDLEHLDFKRMKGLRKDDLMKLVQMFPFHLEVIQEEARRLGVQVDDPSLSVEAEKRKKILQECSGHKAWLDEKKLPLDSPNTLIVSEERLAEIKKHLPPDIEHAEAYLPFIFKLLNYIFEKRNKPASSQYELMAKRSYRFIESDIVDLLPTLLSFRGDLPHMSCRSIFDLCVAVLPQLKGKELFSFTFYPSTSMLGSDKMAFRF